MVSLEPFKLLDHHRAGRKGVRILLRESARYENLGKPRIRSRRLARVPRSGGDDVVDHFSGALHPLNRDAAALALPRRKPPVSASVGLAASAMPLPKSSSKGVVMAKVERMRGS
jgi:hypothetical protein